MGSITSRRSFFLKAGAAMTVPLSAAAASAAGQGDEVDALRTRVAILEDLAAIRELTRKFVRHLNAGDLEAALYADPAAAEPGDEVVGVSLDDVSEADAIALSADGRTASARVRCVARIERPLESCPLVEMARAQGGGTVRRSEPGVLAIEYVREGGTWTVARPAFWPA